MHSKAKRLLTLLLGPVLLIANASAWADLADRSTVNMSPGVTELGLEGTAAMAVVEEPSLE